MAVVHYLVTMRGDNVEAMVEFSTRLVAQFQSPALAFLLGGMLLAALGSRLEIPDAIYKFMVFMLLMRIGLKGGMKISNSRRKINLQ